MNENFRRRYLLPFERIKLKGTYEDKPHGFKQDEKKDEKIDEKSDEKSDEPQGLISFVAKGLSEKCESAARKKRRW